MVKRKPVPYEDAGYTVIYDSYGDDVVAFDPNDDGLVVNDRFVFDLQNPSKILIFARRGIYGEDEDYKDVSLHADKDKVNDLITVLTYWRDNVAND